MKKKFTVIAHRGVPVASPENTLISFEQAIAAEADAIEFDVHMTLDQALVVSHDATVNRCSNGTGEISSYTLKQLKMLDFGKWKAPEFTGVRIPTLDETIDLVTSLRPDMQLLVELKDDSAECTRKVLELLRRRNVIDQCMVLSFHSEQLRLVRQLEPSIPLQGFPHRYLKVSCRDLYDFVDKVCIWNHEASAEEVKGFQEQGIEVDIYPVDDEDQLDRVIATGADSLTTNSLHTILPLLKERGLR